MGYDRWQGVPTFATWRLAPDDLVGLAGAHLVMGGLGCVGVVLGLAAEAEGVLSVGGGHGGGAGYVAESRSQGCAVRTRVPARLCGHVGTRPLASLAPTRIARP